MSAPKVEGVTVFVEDSDTFECEGMMAVVGLAVSVIWHQKVGWTAPTDQTSRPRTTHDAGDNLVLILACPPACAQCPSFISPISTTPVPTHTLVQLQR